jgi:hypothetical protein
MAYIYPTYKMNSQNNFGPTDQGYLYQPAYYHNKTSVINHHKNKWCLKKNQQYEVFRVSSDYRDNNNCLRSWHCSSLNALVSILDNGKEVFGNQDERLAIFRVPQNITDTWHGYPFQSSDYDISENLLDFWEENKIIDSRIRRKIAKGEL